MGVTIYFISYFNDAYYQNSSSKSEGSQYGVPARNPLLMDTYAALGIK